MQRTYTRLFCTVPVAVFLFCGTSDARDEFDGVRCGHVNLDEFMGRGSRNEAVAKTEARHRDLRLKDLGGDEVSDDLNSVEWSICGTDYEFLYDSRGVVRDVLPFPPHSRAAPAFEGRCKRKGQALTATIFASLDYRTADMHGTSHYGPNDTTLLAVKAAWSVDERSGKFVQLSTTGLFCPRSGIVTVDAGP